MACRNAIVLVALLLILPAPIPALPWSIQSHPSASSFNQTQMRSALDQFVAAANVLDAKSVGSLWEPDGSFQDGPETPVMVGRDNITAFWVQGFSPPWLVSLNFVATSIVTDRFGNANLAGVISMTVTGKKGLCWVHLPEAFLVEFGESYGFHKVTVVYPDESENAQLKACLA